LFKIDKQIKFIVYKILNKNNFLTEYIIKSIYKRKLDVDYYLSLYRDVANSKINPVEHYVKYGESENRNPTLYFQTSYVRSQLSSEHNRPFLFFLLFMKDNEVIPNIGIDMGEWTIFLRSKNVKITDLIYYLNDRYQPIDNVTYSELKKINFFDKDILQRNIRNLNVYHNYDVVTRLSGKIKLQNKRVKLINEEIQSIIIIETFEGEYKEEKLNVLKKLSNNPSTSAVLNLFDLKKTILGDQIFYISEFFNCDIIDLEKNVALILSQIDRKLITIIDSNVGISLIQKYSRYLIETQHEIKYIFFEKNKNFNLLLEIYQKNPDVNIQIIDSKLDDDGVITVKIVGLSKRKKSPKPNNQVFSTNRDLNLKSISVVLNVHREQNILEPTIQSLLASIQLCKFIRPDYLIQFHVVADKSDTVTLKIIDQYLSGIDQIHTVSFGDLGESRNYITKKVSTNFITFHDGDDLISENYIQKCISVIENGHQENVVLHPEFLYYFRNSFQLTESNYFVYQSNSRIDLIRNLLFMNVYSSSGFAKRDLFMKYPYSKIDIGKQKGFEDWDWNRQTLCDGVKHLGVKSTVHCVRISTNSLSKETDFYRALPTFKHDLIKF
jgi:hypothetical protein